MTVSVFVSALLFTAAALVLHEYTRQNSSLEAMREKISGVLRVPYNGPSVGPSMRVEEATDEPVALLPSPDLEWDLHPDRAKDARRSYENWIKCSIRRSSAFRLDKEAIAKIAENDRNAGFARRQAFRDMSGEEHFARGAQQVDREFACETADRYLNGRL